MKKARPHILVLPSWYPPDGGHFFQDQAEALAAEGFQVDLLVNRVVGLSKLRMKHAYTYRRFAVSEQNGTRIIRSAFLKGPRMEECNTKRWVRSTLRLYRKYRRRFGKPDLLLAHSAIWAGVVAARIKDEEQLPFILVEHRSRFTMDAEAAQNLLKPAYRPRLEYGFSRADRIACVSRALQPSIRSYLPESMHGKLLSIPNMVDTRVFDPDKVAAPEALRKDSPRKDSPREDTRREDSRREDSRREDSPRKDKIRILSVGRLEREKGMDLLIAALARLAGEGMGVDLHIVGAGPERPGLEKQVDEAGLASRVHFKGKLSGQALLEEYKAADVFALASRYEAFGVVFIEAMSMGLPVLATRAGGPQHFIPELAGTVVASDDETALYLGLQRMLHTLDSYDPLVIRKHVEAHFSRQAVARQYVTLIRSLLHD